MPILNCFNEGHVHKPGTPAFLENLHFTEQAVKQTYELFEETFKDRSTAYILTSDHGMTNAGSYENILFSFLFTNRFYF